MSMTQVARLAGVSQSTVSRVVNGRSFVNEETRRRVFESMEKCGYEAPPPDQRTGRNPKLESRSHSGLLAVLVDSVGMRLHSEFVMNLYRAVQSEANREGYSTILHFLETGASLPPVFHRVDGFLVVGLPGSAPLPKRVRSRPVVCLTSFWQSGATSILAGNDEVGQLAAEYLAGRGHQRLAVFLAEAGNPSFGARGRAFLKEAKDAINWAKKIATNVAKLAIKIAAKALQSLNKLISALQKIV
ncbi:MAG: LacI family DNA-binding transcriptional regulator, partial [Verrucomicrobiota bacterium]